MNKVRNIFCFSLATAIFLGIYISTVNANSNIETKKNIVFLDNSSIELTFTERYTTNDNKQVLIYEDEKNNDYFYKDDKLIAYINEDYYSKENVNERESAEELNSNNTAKQIDSNSAKRDEIANSYLEYFAPQTANAKSITNSYELIRTTYLDATDEYSYFYAKKIDGYLVNDGVLISLDEDGNLISYSGAQQGMYDDYTDININEDAVNDFVIKEMNNLGISNYSIDKEYINLVNNKLVLQIGIKILHDNGAISTTVLYYEL